MSRMLIGIKSRIEPFRAWLLSWGSDTPPDTNPCSLCGPSGVGKTTIAVRVSPDLGFHPEIYSGDGLNSFLDMVRLPTMLGRRRLAIIDDAQLLSKKEWKVVESEVKSKQIPILLTVEDAKQIPWSIRRQTLRVDIPLPTQSQLVKFLRNQDSDSDSNIEAIATASPTWRQAELNLLTTPPDSESDLPVSVRSETELSLIGLLSFAEFNNADPEAVGAGIVLHSHGWEIPGMTKLVQDYVETIQTQSQDRVPYRNRPLRGSTRRI